MTPKERAEIRRLVADYMRSEGCSCCRDSEAHDIHTVALAKALGVRKYGDGSGYDFARHRSPQPKS
jgi:methionine aminopeptidase